MSILLQNANDKVNGLVDQRSDWDLQAKHVGIELNVFKKPCEQTT